MHWELLVKEDGHGSIDEFTKHVTGYPLDDFS